VGDDDIDARADQLRRELRGTIGSVLRGEKLDSDVLTFGVAEALETTAECIGERMRRRCRHQHADARHFSRLLGERSARRDEQTGRQDTDDIAPSQIASRACGLRSVDTTKGPVDGTRGVRRCGDDLQDLGSSRLLFRSFGQRASQVVILDLGLRV